MQRVFADTALFAGRDLSVRAATGEPVRVRGEVVTERYPGVLGVASGDRAGRSPPKKRTCRGTPGGVAMIGHALWTRRVCRRSWSDRPIRDAQHTGLTPSSACCREGFSGLGGNAEAWVRFAAFEPGFLTAALRAWLLPRRASRPAAYPMHRRDRSGEPRRRADYRARIQRFRAADSWGATAASSVRIAGRRRRSTARRARAFSARWASCC